LILVQVSPEMKLKGTEELYVDIKGLVKSSDFKFRDGKCTFHGAATVIGNKADGGQTVCNGEMGIEFELKVLEDRRLFIRRRYLTKNLKLTCDDE
jgi:hypothetical protein